MRLFQTRRPILNSIPPVTPRPPWLIPGDLLPAEPTDDQMDRLDDLLAESETEGRIARTTARLLLLADELEARHVRYAWTERLAEDLRAIAHDTPVER